MTSVSSEGTIIPAVQDQSNSKPGRSKKGKEKLPTYITSCYPFVHEAQGGVRYNFDLTLLFDTFISFLNLFDTGDTLWLNI